jgi:hypothetical protein
VRFQLVVKFVPLLAVQLIGLHRLLLYVELMTLLLLVCPDLCYDIDRTRIAAWSLPGDGSYCFDLDGREDTDEEAPEDAYSVDSRTCGESAVPLRFVKLIQNMVLFTGNWTRFIK